MNSFSGNGFEAHGDDTHEAPSAFLNSSAVCAIFGAPSRHGAWCAREACAEHALRGNGFEAHGNDAREAPSAFLNSLAVCAIFGAPSSASQRSLGPSAQWALSNYYETQVL